MQILLHLGAHCTDEGLLLRSILRNRSTLAREGIGVPGPSRYRELLGEVSTSLRGAPASDETEAMILEAIRDDDTAERIVLSNENFLCRANVVIGEDGLYPRIGKSAWLRNCFPGHEVEFALALRNPALLIPDLMSRLDAEARAAMEGLLHYERLRWTDVLIEMLAANPGCPILVWRHEDTPYIWSELLREITAHDPFTRLDGAFEMIEHLITDEGLGRLDDFLSRHGDMTEARRRKTIAAFIEAHPARPDAPPAPPLPGWSDDTEALLTQAYEDDVTELRALPGITFLEP